MRFSIPISILSAILAAATASVQLYSWQGYSDKTCTNQVADVPIPTGPVECTSFEGLGVQAVHATWGPGVSVKFYSNGYCQGEPILPKYNVCASAFPGVVNSWRVDLIP
ncbi:hypothetical protein VTN00DRAFT_88 [Thermoascus crustaceus]|uniref:uncharacterized protein n=1 Tax=Thermoascus crustaceus TaxID=5088 RepID=UPI003742B513